MGSDEQARKDQDSRRPPVLPEHIPTTTELPSQEDRKVLSVASVRPIPPEHTPTMNLSPPLQDTKDTSAAPPRPPVLPKHILATTVPPSISLSQPVSGPSDSNRSKSGIQETEGVDRRAEQAMEV